MGLRWARRWVETCCIAALSSSTSRRAIRAWRACFWPLKSDTAARALPSLCLAKFDRRCLLASCLLLLPADSMLAAVSVASAMALSYCTAAPFSSVLMSWAC
jgi:hypothetical protein